MGNANSTTVDFLLKGAEYFCIGREKSQGQDNRDVYELPEVVGRRPRYSSSGYNNALVTNNGCNIYQNKHQTHCPELFPTDTDNDELSFRDFPATSTPLDTIQRQRNYYRSNTFRHRNMGQQRPLDVYIRRSNEYRTSQTRLITRVCPSPGYGSEDAAVTSQCISVRVTDSCTRYVEPSPWKSSVHLEYGRPQFRQRATGGCERAMPACNVSQVHSALPQSCCFDPRDAPSHLARKHVVTSVCRSKALAHELPFHDCVPSTEACFYNNYISKRGLRL